MEQWKDFYVAEVGASAALAGLFVVAISINIARIIATHNLPERANQALFTIGYILLLTSLGLFPGITLFQFGIAALILAVSLIMNSLRFLSKGLKLGDIAPLIWTLSPFFMVTAVSIPLFVGGVFLVQGNGAGLYWLAASVLLGFVSTLQNGWVLMVEILR